MIEKKTAAEITSIVLVEAQKTGKCQTLTGGDVIAHGHPGDWRFLARWSGAGLSDDSRNEITMIESRLKRLGLRLKTAF